MASAVAPIIHASGVRAIVVALWVFIALRAPVASYAAFPEVDLIGVGPTRFLLDHFATASVLTDYEALNAIRWLIPILGIVCLSRRGTWHWVHPSLFVLCVLLDGIQKSVAGVVHHGQIVPLLLMLVITVRPRTTYLSLPELLNLARGRPIDDIVQHEHNEVLASEVIWLSSIAMILPYTLIALERVLVGGIDLFAGDYLLWFLAASSYGFDSYLIDIRPDAIQLPLKAGFLVTTLFELTSVFALRWRQFRRAWVVVLGTFHLLTLVFMNVFFFENLLIMVAVFWWADWTDRAPYRATT